MAKYKTKMYYNPEIEEESKVEETVSHNFEKISSELESIPEQIINESKIKINEFLSNYSIKRNIDSVFSKWIYSKDNSNTSKTVTEWKNLFQKFLNEK